MLKRSLLFIFLVLVMLSVGTASAASLASDDFNRADNTDLGANWYESFGENAIENQTLRMTDNAFNGVIWSANSFSGNRKISFSYVDFNQSENAGWRIRLNNTANDSFSGNYIRVRDSGNSIEYYDGSSLIAPTGGNGQQAITDGQTVSVSINDSMIWMWVDNTFIGYWETSLSSGYVGFYTDIAGSQWGIDNFIVTDTLDSFGTEGEAKYYYVSTEGDDGNDGLTPETAFATPDYALSQATAGTTINISYGTYINQTLNFLVDDITIIGNDAKLEGNYLLGTAWKNEGLTIDGRDNITIHDLEIYHYYRSAAVIESTNITFEGCELWGDPNENFALPLYIGSGSSYIYYKNGSIHSVNSGWNLIEITSSDTLDTHHIYFENNSLYGGIQHNIFNLQNGADDYGDDLHHVYILNNEIYDTTGVAIATNHASIWYSEISNNTVYDSQWGVCPVAVNTTFAYNTIYNVTGNKLGSYTGTMYNCTFDSNNAITTLYSDVDNTVVKNLVGALHVWYGSDGDLLVQNWTETQQFIDYYAANTTFENDRLFYIDLVSGSGSYEISDYTVDSAGIASTTYTSYTDGDRNYNLVPLDYQLIPVTSATVTDVTEEGFNCTLSGSDDVTLTQISTSDTQTISLDAGTTYIAFSDYYLAITDYTPADTTPTSEYGTPVIFSITTSKESDIDFYVDGILKESGTNVTYLEYEKIGSVGVHNVTAIADDGVDTVSQTWTLTVESGSETPVNPTFVAVGGGFAAVTFAIGSWINQRRKRF